MSVLELRAVAAPADSGARGTAALMLTGNAVLRCRRPRGSIPQPYEHRLIFNAISELAVLLFALMLDCVGSDCDLQDISWPTRPLRHNTPPRG